MAKRFIDTDFYRSPYVRSLQGPLKALYVFIICDSSGAGIWTKDLLIAGAYTGFNYTDSDFALFVKSGKAIDLANGKYFFPDFIDHQYPSGLQQNNKAHKNFINELLKYNLIDENLKVLRRGLEGSLYGSQVMVMVKEEVMVQVKDTVTASKKDRPSSREQVSDYMTELGVINQQAIREAQKFMDHFTSNGWKIGGKAPMKDWRASVRTWVGKLHESLMDQRLFGGVKQSDIERQQQELNSYDNANS